MNPTLSQLQATAIGQPFEGGFFGGIVRVAEKLHAVIWAPMLSGDTKARWLDSFTAVPGADSCSDSLANTLAMAEAGSEAARWALGLRIGGFDDWCLPARDVLELAYRHLKPTTTDTACSFRDGDNPTSVPAGYPYTDSAPVVQTSVQAFQEGGPEAFEPRWYWSSTQFSESDAWGQYFNLGDQFNFGKSYEARARAVRLIQLSA